MEAVRTSRLTPFMVRVFSVGAAWAATFMLGVVLAEISIVVTRHLHTESLTNGFIGLSFIIGCLMPQMWLDATINSSGNEALTMGMSWLGGVTILIWQVSQTLVKNTVPLPQLIAAVIIGLALLVCREKIVNIIDRIKS